MTNETKAKINDLNCCVIIPTYNNEKTLAKVIAEVSLYAEHIIVVNDGSTDSTSAVLEQFDFITVCSYPKNRGKGFALRTGFKKAIDRGFDYALTIDSDGQHYPSDIPLFAEKAKEHPDAILIGSRNLKQENIPGKNTFANRFSNFWFRLETGQKLDDTQSGFRLYPLQKIKDIRFYTKKYEFELEVLVRSAWRGVQINPIPIQVFYPPQEERVSHFKPFRDFARISLLNTIFVLVALLWVKPFGFIRSLNKENVKKFLNEHVMVSSEPKHKIVFSVMLGVFMGIVPVWGYQMIIAFTLAHWLKLNKAITLVASNISIPPMIPIILFASYALGAGVLGYPLELSLGEVNFDTVKQDLLQYIVGSFALAAVCALLFGLIAYLMVVVRRVPVRRANNKT